MRTQKPKATVANTRLNVDRSRGRPHRSSYTFVACGPIGRPSANVSHETLDPSVYHQRALEAFNDE